MRFIIFAIFIFNLIDGFAQKLISSSDSLVYNLYFHYDCNNQIEKITEYFIGIRVNGSITEYVPDSSGTCILPCSIDSNLVLRTKKLGTVFTTLDKKTKVFNDTIIIPPIYQAPSTTAFVIGPTYYSYYHCGQKCHGVEKSYRKDGKLWQMGHFKRGNLKSYKSYYLDGTLASKTKERKLHGCNVHYDVNGILELKMKYFLFISYYKIYDKENKKYIKKLGFRQYIK
jgi:hypothetical protein